MILPLWNAKNPLTEPRADTTVKIMMKFITGVRFSALLRSTSLQFLTYASSPHLPQSIPLDVRNPWGQILNQNNIMCSSPLHYWWKPNSRLCVVGHWPPLMPPWQPYYTSLFHTDKHTDLYCYIWIDMYIAMQLRGIKNTMPCTMQSFIVR